MRVSQQSSGAELAEARPTLGLKFLVDGKAVSGFEYPLPWQTKAGHWHAGKWVHVSGEIRICRRGIHAAPLTLFAAGVWKKQRTQAFVIQLREVVESHDDKMVARSGRLLCPIEFELSRKSFRPYTLRQAVDGLVAQGWTPGGLARPTLTLTLAEELLMPSSEAVMSDDDLQELVHRSAETVRG